MKKVYIAVSFADRKKRSKEIDVIAETVLKHNLQPLVFVNKYEFSGKQEKEMMDQAIEDMDSSSLLIAELSKKSIGVGLEVGYATARNIPVLYLKNEEAEYSTTVGGVCSAFISYKDTDDLSQKLDTYLRTQG